jgi:hypothetical protein
MKAAAWAFAIPGLVASYYSAAQYVGLGRQALAARGEPGPAAT